MTRPYIPPFAWNLHFEVRTTGPFGPLHPAQARLFIVGGRYNMALVDSEGAPMRVFIPNDSTVESIIAALNAASPGGEHWPYEIVDLMGYEPDPADFAEA